MYLERLIDKMGNKKDIFVALVEENQGIIHKICRAYTDTQEEHNDLFQEVVLQLWKSYNSFKENAKFSTWLYRVTLNTAITLIRKRKKSITITSTEKAPQIADHSTYDYELEEQIEQLYKAIKRLSEIERALILLYLEEKSFKEIAETMGISEVNARVKMTRTKTKLKEIMEKWK